MKKLMMFLMAATIMAGLAQVQAQPQGQAAKPALISPKAARDLLASSKDALLVDVRSLEEFVAGRIAGSVLLPYDQITAASAAAVIGPNKDRTVIVYCRSGRRSEIAAATLVSLGYRRVLDLGGIASWPYATIKGQPKKP
jgi:rhodanese-related sulfurtransferase